MLNVSDHFLNILLPACLAVRSLVVLSGGMCLLGYDSTVPVTMDEMLMMSKAVRRGAPNTFIIGDMPFMSYQTSVEDAVKNAGRFIKEAGSDAIKLEGGVSIKAQIKGIVDAGILVFGHCGMTPQSSGQLGGNLAQGRTVKSAKAVIEDSYAVADAGAQFLLLEAVPPEVGGFIAQQLDIPVYGIGAGHEMDGQLLIISDVIGEFQAFTPKFVKKYANVAEVMTTGLKAYNDDVKARVCLCK
eukprot:SAG31_NODE_3858_length_3815_cov_2.457212_3_plen_242_part_00